jgi:hypothetical protein
MDSKSMARAPSNGAAKTLTSNDKVELDHAIGFSGKVVDSVYLHPNAKDYVLIAGCSIVVCDLTDPHN